MVIVTDSGQQGVTVIPRAEPSGSVSLSVRSKAQNKTLYTATPTTLFTEGELRLTWTPSEAFVLDNFYYLELTEGSTLLWRGQAFCTDQTVLPKYTTNNGKFNEYSGNNNEFITI